MWMIVVVVDEAEALQTYYLINFFLLYTLEAS